jgi:hypothetical protein
MGLCLQRCDDLLIEVFATARRVHMCAKRFQRRCTDLA